MAGWHPDCYQRAAAYVTDPSGRLLVSQFLDLVTPLTWVLPENPFAQPAPTTPATAPQRVARATRLCWRGRPAMSQPLRRFPGVGEREEAENVRRSRAMVDAQRSVPYWRRPTLEQLAERVERLEQRVVELERRRVT